MTRTNRGIVAQAQEGDQLYLSKYLSGAVTVVDRQRTPDGPVLVVESTGQSRYRLRAIDDDDDRLLMEKPDDGGGWTAFIRLDAERPEPIPNDLNP